MRAGASIAGEKETLGVLEPLHPGYGFSIPFFVLLSLSAAVCLIVIPLFVVSYTINLRNAVTREQVTCHVALAPGFRPAKRADEGVSICAMTCQDAGFVIVSGQVPIVWDLAPGGYERMQQEWLIFIPPQCRSHIASAL